MDNTERTSSAFKAAAASTDGRGNPVKPGPTSRWPDEFTHDAAPGGEGGSDAPTFGPDFQEID